MSNGDRATHSLADESVARPLDEHSEAELLRRQNHVLELIARGRPLRETLDVLLRAIDEQCEGMLSSILLVDADGVHVRHGAAPHLPDSYVRAIDGSPIGAQAGSCGTAAFRREAVIVEDIATDWLWEPYREVALSHGLRACWSTPIFDSEGRVLGTFAMYFPTTRAPTARHLALIDVSTSTAAIAIAQHRERQERARREAQFAEAQRIAHIGSYEWSVTTGAVRRSDELCRIFGLAPEEFAPTFEAYLERVHPEDRPRTAAIVTDASRNHTPFDFEERIVRPDGAVRNLRSQGKWFFDSDGRAEKLVGICQDITERKQAEEQARRSEELRVRNEELKAFAYMVSHDLKAPLRGIAGYANELDRRHRASLGERAARCVSEIVAGTQMLDWLIEDLLHYSRLDAEMPTDEQVSLPEMIEAILHDRHATIRTQGTDVSVALAVTSVRTWERGLLQVLTNLIDNAIKYSKDARPPRISITSEQRPGAVSIRVADNGIGFDMRHHDRIFGLFHRQVEQGAYEGTGAGLAIVKKIVDKIGGRVWAESSPGAGATFHVELPAGGPAEA